MTHAVLIAASVLLEIGSVRVHPAYPIAQQPSWQASVPVPIHITYDVPNNGEWEDDPVTLRETLGQTQFSQTRLENTSFALTPEHMIASLEPKEQFSIRLHAPSETLQQSLDGVKAVQGAWEDDQNDSLKGYAASKQTLFDAIGMNMKRVVRVSMAPLTRLRNPLT